MLAFRTFVGGTFVGIAGCVPSRVSGCVSSDASIGISVGVSGGISSSVSGSPVSTCSPIGNQCHLLFASRVIVCTAAGFSTIRGMESEKSTLKRW